MTRFAVTQVRIPMVGVDPGGRYVGIAVTDGTELVRARVLDRERARADHRLGWVTFVLAAIREELDTGVDGVELGAANLAVEDVRAPTGHARGRAGHIIRPDGVVDTAVVVGAVLGQWPGCALIEPGGNGDDPDVAYPAPIRRGARLGGPSDHARSAFDVARTATFLRFVAATRTPPPTRGGRR